MGKTQMGQDLISSSVGYGTEASAASLPISSGLRTSSALNITILIVACVGMIYVVSRVWLAALLKRRRHGIDSKTRHQFSCYHCHYFGQNPYLQCALHPTTVLTERAVNCRDYAS